MNTKLITVYENPLLFWKDNEKKFPILSKLSQSIYVIPASQACSERTFSLCTNILGKKKTLMKPETMDALIRYRSYLLYTKKLNEEEAKNEEK